VRAKYVEAINRGEAWSDDQIAYDLDPAARATCVHLRPVETLLRAAPVRVKLWVPPNLRVAAVLDFEALKQRVPLPANVTYAEGSMGGRAYEDGLFSMLRCGSCESRIDFTHRHEARAGEPVFPEPL
jgi:hypothetical protein